MTGTTDVGAGPARHPVLHRVTLGLAFAYLFALVLIAFWPTPVDRDAHDSIEQVVGSVQTNGGPTWLRYSAIEFGANIALFVPVGLFVVLLAGARRWKLGILVGFAATCTIELGQLVFLTGRVATPYDVVANTGGAVIGALLAVAALAVLRRVRARVPAR